jgi:hypothetical protein
MQDDYDEPPAQQWAGEGSRAKRPKFRPASEEANAPRSEGNDELFDVISDEEVVTLLSNQFFDLCLDEVEQMHDVCMSEEKQAVDAIRGLTETEYIQSAEQEAELTKLGDWRVSEFNRYMSQFKMARYGPQMRMIRGALESLVPQMYGDDFDACRPRIALEMGFADFRQQLFVTMPRRRGKTRCMCAIETACQLTMGGKTAFFAAALIQSTEMLLIVQAQMEELGCDSWILSQNSRRMVISRGGVKGKLDDCGTIRCYSSSVTAARGFTAKRIYFDEAMFARVAFFVKNVFAGMLLKNVFLLMVSSPNGTVTPFAMVCDLRHPLTGEKEFKVINLQNLCDDCKKSKKLLECPHIFMPQPPWFTSQEDQDKIGRAMSVISPQSYRAEILGLGDNDNLPAFDNQSITALAEGRARTIEREQLKEIIVGLDLSGGGQSESAMCAMACDRDGQLVVSLALRNGSRRSSSPRPASTNSVKLRGDHTRTLPHRLRQRRFARCLRYSEQHVARRSNGQPAGAIGPRLSKLPVRIHVRRDQHRHLSDELRITQREARRPLLSTKRPARPQRSQVVQQPATQKLKARPLAPRPELLDPKRRVLQRACRETEQQLHHRTGERSVRQYSQAPGVLLVRQLQHRQHLTQPHLRQLAVVVHVDLLQLTRGKPALRFGFSAC